MQIEYNDMHGERIKMCIQNSDIMVITRMSVTNKMQQIFHLLIFLIQPYVFRATNSAILRSTF